MVDWNPARCICCKLCVYITDLGYPFFGTKEQSNTKIGKKGNMLAMKLVWFSIQNKMNPKSTVIMKLKYLSHVSGLITLNRTESVIVKRGYVGLRQHVTRLLKMNYLIIL